MIESDEALRATHHKPSVCGPTEPEKPGPADTDRTKRNLSRRELVARGALLTGLLAKGGCMPPPEDGTLRSPRSLDPEPKDEAANPLRIPPARNPFNGSVTPLASASAAPLAAPAMPGNSFTSIPPLPTDPAELQGANGAASVPQLSDSVVPRPSPQGAALRLRKLVERITFGPTAAELGLAESLGYEGYLEYQLNPGAIDDSPVDQRLKDFPTLTWTQRQILEAVRRGDRAPIHEFLFSTILRAIYSRRQLHERMVEFWSDHLNIYFWKSGVPERKPVDDRDVIRAHTLGRFPQLLLASAASPAMLIYLDNAFSYAGHPNQNYAREVLELHALGLGNFTQADVEEVARCFTGWTIDFNSESATYGDFIFEPGRHDDGDKTVLGIPIPAGGGVRDGQIVIDILTLNERVAPITARFLAAKLANRFWGYRPPTELVDSAVQAYLDQDGDIRAMLRAILAERWMELAPPKFRRPFHLAVSVLRAAAAEVRNYDVLSHVIDTMGQHPFYWPPPNGYPDTLEYWSQSLLPRWDFGNWLFAGQQNLIDLDLRPFFSLQLTSQQFVDAIDHRLFFGMMSDADRSALFEFLQSNLGGEYRRREALGLAVGLMSYQTF